MEVTDVRLTMLQNAGGVKAIGSFSLDGEFAIRGIRVMEDKNGRNFVAFPSREKQDKTYEDVAFPISKDSYHKITEAILDKFQMTREQNQTKSKEENDTPFIDEAFEEEQKKSETPKKKGKGR